jgi:hypothetical protein
LEVTRDHVLVLVSGALLSPSQRTVTASLHVIGSGQNKSFAVYHSVLSIAYW